MNHKERLKSFLLWIQTTILPDKYKSTVHNWLARNPHKFEDSKKKTIKPPALVRVFKYKI